MLMYFGFVCYFNCQHIKHTHIVDGVGVGDMAQDMRETDFPCFQRRSSIIRTLYRSDWFEQWANTVDHVAGRSVFQWLLFCTVFPLCMRAQGGCVDKATKQWKLSFFLSHITSKGFCALITILTLQSSYPTLFPHHIVRRDPWWSWTVQFQRLSLSPLIKEI